MFETEAKKFEDFVGNSTVFYDARRMQIYYFKYTFSPKYLETWREELWCVKSNEKPYDWYVFRTSLNCKEVLECIHIFFQPRNDGEVQHTREDVVQFAKDYLKNYSNS